MCSKIEIIFQSNHFMFILGISGGSGSGKTTFLKDLKSHFSDAELTILSLDDYYHPRETQLVDDEGVRNFDLPTSIDLDAFKKDIDRLKSGETVTRKEYTFNNDKKEPKDLVFTPSPILIVEGLFIYSDLEIRDLIDFSLLIHASDVVKVIRRIKRDRVERNYPLEDVLYRYEHHVMPSFEKYIRPYIDKVDVVINNNHNYDNALTMMVGYLKSKIKAEV